MSTQAIMRFALEKVYAEKTDLMLTLISATPHPQISAEILLGIYQKPDLRGTDTKEYDAESKTNIRFISLNDIEQTVEFEYNPVNKKYGWVMKGTQNPTEEDVIGGDRWADNMSRKMGISETELKENYEYVMYHHEIRPTRVREVMELSTWYNYTINHWKEIAEETMFEE